MTATARSASAPPVQGQWPQGRMSAAAITGPHRAGLLETAVPAPAPGEALLAPLLVGLCGTDVELLHGTATYVRDGRAPYPHVFGHEWVARVVAVAAGPRGASRVAAGDRVVGHTMLSCGACRSCHRGARNECERLHEVGLYGRPGAAAEYLRMPLDALSVVPPGVPDRTAVLTEPAVTVYAAFERARLSPGDRVLVLGTGTIGLLAVQGAVRIAATVDVVGIDDAGLRTAQDYGARHALRPGAAPPGHYDVVIEASGATTAAHEALRAVRVGGAVALVGVAPDTADGVDFGDVTLRGVSVHGIRHGLDHYDRVLALMDTGAVDADRMIAAVLPLDRLDEAFTLVQQPGRPAPKVLLDLTTARAHRRRPDQRKDTA